MRSSRQKDLSKVAPEPTGVYVPVGPGLRCWGPGHVGTPLAPGPVAFEPLVSGLVGGSQVQTEAHVAPPGGSSAPRRSPPGRRSLGRSGTGAGQERQCQQPASGRGHRRKSAGTRLTLPPAGPGTGCSPRPWWRPRPSASRGSRGSTGAPGPDAAVHPHTGTVKPAHTPVTRTAVLGRRWFP